MPTIGVALAIPEPWATQLQDYRTSVGDTTAAMIPTHITLVPPTEVDEADLPRSRRTSPTSAAGCAAFCVHLRGTGTFRPVSPVVFVTLVEGISQCEQLAAAVRQGPLDVDLPVPLPPARDHRPPPARRRRWTARSTSWPTSSASSTSTDFHLYVHDDETGWQPTRDFPLRPMPAAELIALASRSGSPRRSHGCASAARSSTTWSGPQEHYGEVRASQQAGAVTYFAFLSFFPILALAFFVVGQIAKVYPDAQDDLRRRPSTR